jgi:hypothetical protein
VSYNKEEDTKQAKRELVYLKAVKELLLLDNDMGIDVEVHNIKFSLSLNSNLIPIVDYEIQQIKLFLKGKENTWE